MWRKGPLKVYKTIVLKIFGEAYNAMVTRRFPLNEELECLHHLLHTTFTPTSQGYYSILLCLHYQTNQANIFVFSKTNEIGIAHFNLTFEG